MTGAEFVRYTIQRMYGAEKMACLSHHIFGRK